MISCLRGCATTPAAALAAYLPATVPAGRRLIDHLPAGTARWYASGRMALHHALAAHGVGPGDEVLVPPYVAAGVVDPIRALGARARFVASGPGLTADLNAVAAAFRPRTKAVIVVHHLAQPQPVAAIAAWCAQRGLVLVEDCAQALLSRHADGRPYGSHGDIALFSLTKFLTVSDGAVVVVRDAARAPSQPTTMRRTAGHAVRRLRVHLAAVDAAHRAPPGSQPWRAVGDSYLHAYRLLARDFAASRPSRATLDIIRRLDATAVAERRRSIIARLAAGLANSALTPFGDWRLPGAVPLALGALVPPGRREALVAEALRHGVLLASLVHLWDYTAGVDCPHDIDHRDRHVLIPVGEHLDDAAVAHLIATLNRL